MKNRTIPFWQTTKIATKETFVPKFTEVTSTDSGRAKTPVNLAEYTALLQSQERGKNITLPLDTDERPRVIMQFLNTAAEQLGYKLFRVSGNTTEIVFRIVTERGPNKRTTTKK